MRIVADQPFRRVAITAWTAAGLTAVGLSVDVLRRWWDLGLLGRASLIAALIAWGFMLAMRLRLRSASAHNDRVYAALFEGHPQPILLADDHTLAIVAVNSAAREKYGYTDAGFEDLSIYDLHCPEDREMVRSTWAALGETVGKARRAGTHVAKDGTTFAAEVLTTTLDLHGRLLRMEVVDDVTDKDAAFADTRESGARYRQIFETAKEGILIVDADSSISMVNERGAQMLGYSIEELVGHRISEFSGAAGAEFARTAAVQRTEGKLAGERETTLRHKDGTIVSVLLNQSPLLDRNGLYAGQLGMITDLTERKGFEDELAFRAIHDPLTGLPNRLLLVDRLQLALGRAKPGRAGVAVLYVDVDGFKDVNIAHGNHVGDQLLTAMASRMSGKVRERSTIARFGGDEFVIVADDAGAFAQGLADRVRASLAAPYVVGGARIEVTVSIGVAVGQNGDRADTLLRAANMALLQAKANGRNRTEFFTEALRATSKQKLAIVSDLRRAVERSEFSLRFQPVVSLDDERIIGAEALIRWEHPTRGTLDPEEFISVAEEAALIDPIGRWVIEETCRRFADWQRLAPQLSMSLNVSAKQLSSGILDETVRDAIAASGVDPTHLALEITEAVLMDDVDIAVGTLTELRKTGVIISLDDFGTGYSSLSRLNMFPIDTLKIDRSFVSGLPGDAYDTALVEAVLAIAKSLDLSVIAEGVESAAQAEALLRMGCKKAQGFHFSKPLTAAAFEAELVATHSPRATRQRTGQDDSPESILWSHRSNTNDSGRRQLGARPGAIPGRPHRQATQRKTRATISR